MFLHLLVLESEDLLVLESEDLLVLESDDLLVLESEDLLVLESEDLFTEAESDSAVHVHNSYSRYREIEMWVGPGDGISERFKAELYHHVSFFSQYSGETGDG